MYSSELMALLSVKGFGIQTLQKLLKFYGDTDGLISSAKANTVFSDTGIKATKDLHMAFEKFDAEKYRKALKKENVNVLTFEDDHYPRVLKTLDQFPPLLHYKGAIDLLNDLPSGIAVVGSRRISAYGKRVAFDIGRFLGRFNLPVISGLAYGVDYEVHRGVVHSGGIPFAVLANGLETIYPKEHMLLSKKIEASGALITEEFLYSELSHYKFPIRNRLISGLAKIIVVVEAEEKSGSLITAQHGLNQGKTVFAVPGSIYSETSKGSNQLIADGAMPLLSLTQLIEEYESIHEEESVASSAVVPDTHKLDGVAIQILEILKRHHAMGIDDLQQHINMTALDLSIALMRMEVEGLIRSIDGNKYMLL